MVEEFISGLINTNRSHSFFVNWIKVNEFEIKYRDELALLSIISQNPDSAEIELKRLILEYPRIAELVPLLLAVRLKSKKLDVVDEVTMLDIKYEFNSMTVHQNAEKIIEFTKKTGLLNELKKIKNVNDYYFGVEVGSDTNARKNRSGFAMEELIEPYVYEFVKKNNGKMLTQKNFEYASSFFGVKLPLDESNKRGDFMLQINGVPINIEVNYFDGNGSKQEIINSYIPRAQNLNKAGWKFALVTDGAGWKQNKKQLEFGFREIKNIYNAKMCREGKLNELL